MPGHASPVVVATLQSTALASVSNIIGQLLSQHKHSEPYHLDGPQFIRFLAVTLLTAPPNFYWQGLLERTLPARKGQTQQDKDIELEEGLSKRRDEENILASDPMAGEGSARFEHGRQGKLSWRNTFAKWFVDCITMGALLNTLAFLILMGIFKAKSLDNIIEDVRQELVPIIVAGYKIWPLASVINFTLIPVEKRIVFLSAVGLVWGVYLSLVAANT